MKVWIGLLAGVFMFTLTANAGLQPQEVSLGNAISAKMVDYKFVSKGGSTGFCVNVYLKNKSAQPILVTVEPGTRLACADSGQQDILVVFATKIYLEGYGTQSADLAGLCCEQKNASPLKGVGFHFQGMENPELVKFAQGIDANRFDKTSKQDELWKLCAKVKSQKRFISNMESPVENPPVDASAIIEATSWRQ